MLFKMIDRLALLQILPREGDNILDIKAVHHLRLALAPSDEEAAELDRAVDANGMLNEKSEIAQRTVEMEIGPRAHTVVQKTLEAALGRKTFPEACLGVWDLFMEEEGKK